MFQSILKMKKILVIEDNKDILENIEEVLELSHYQVRTAANGKLGIEEAIAHIPDLILCDGQGHFSFIICKRGSSERMLEIDRPCSTIRWRMSAMPTRLSRAKLMRG